MKNIFFTLVSFCYLSVYSQFTNVLISANSTPREPAIAMDLNNTNHLFAATNLNNYYVSNDGGNTWSENTITSSLGIWGDASLLIDNSGDLYFFHLSNPSNGNWIDRIICQKSTDNGISFNDGSFFGLNGTKAQDKEWVVMDRYTANIYVSWTEFDEYGSTNPNDKSRILFTKSTDLGTTWSSPIQLNVVDGDCVDSSNTVEGAVPTVGPAGQIYTAWSGPAGIRFNKSTDMGNTWLSQPILVDAQASGWDYAIPGIYRGNGLPITACDISHGPYRGTIYVNWSDQRNGTDDTDIWLKKSTDGGATWSNLIRVNDDVPGKQQFFTWMTIDQTNGYIYIVFYDRRNYDNNLTDVYLARSTDGGNTFTNYKISETAFLPTSSTFFGDYTNITAHNGVIRPIWTSLNNGHLKVWTALINDALLSDLDELPYEPVSLLTNYPNPSKDETSIAFKLRYNSTVSLSIYNTQGKKIASILNEQQFNTGIHIIPISWSDYKLSKGMYYYTLRTKNTSLTKKLMIQ